MNICAYSSFIDLQQTPLLGRPMDRRDADLDCCSPTQLERACLGDYSQCYFYHFSRTDIPFQRTSTHPRTSKPSVAAGVRRVPSTPKAASAPHLTSPHFTAEPSSSCPLSRSYDGFDPIHLRNTILQHLIPEIMTSPERLRFGIKCRRGTAPCVPCPTGRTFETLLTITSVTQK